MAVMECSRWGLFWIKGWEEVSLGGSHAEQEREGSSRSMKGRAESVQAEEWCVQRPSAYWRK